MKTILILLLMSICIVSSAQIKMEPETICIDRSQAKPDVFPKVTECGVYRVCKIHIDNTFYLIFLEKENEKYTILSNKETLHVNGIKLKKDKNYYLELTYISNEMVLMPINYMDILYYGFTAKEIGKLCTAKNLFGLILKDYFVPLKK
jgi:hypothetical protein